MHHFTWNCIESRAIILAQQNNNPTICIYGVPRGGIYAAQAVARYIPRAVLVEHPENAGWIIDDILDSGSTRNKYQTMFPEIPFDVLVDKQKQGLKGWVVFPWERMCQSEKKTPETVEDNIRRILQSIGDDPNREGLRETPDRVVRSYAELFAGYKQDPSDVFKTFDGDGYDEIVLLKDIEIHSMCEHHMLPFIGRAHVAYIPKGKVIGLSKLARLVDIFARRLQIQEKLTTQVTGALNQFLKPQGTACIIQAKHLCVSCRGVQKQHSSMVTSSLTGVFKEEHSARQELLTLIYGGH